MPTDIQQKPPARGYSATKDQLQARLKRVEGQVRGVQGMVEDDRTEALMAAVGRLLRHS